MPGLDVTFLNQVTRDKFIPVLKNQIYNRTVLMNHMFGRGVQTLTGPRLEWRAVAKRHGAHGLFEGFDVLANQPVNPLVDASLAPANYYATLAISGDEERKNSGNAEKLLDMVQVQFDNAIATMREQMSNDLYDTGTPVGGRNRLIGTAGAVADDNVYAGIDRSQSANSFWRSYVDTTARTDDDLMDEQDRSTWFPAILRTAQLSATFDDSPDYMVFTKDLYNLYQDIAASLNLRFGNDVANLGFGAVQFGSGPIIVYDDFIPDRSVYLLTMNDWSVYAYQGAEFDMIGQGWYQAQSQDAKLAHIIWSGAIRLSVPRHQARFTNLGGAS